MENIAHRDDYLTHPAFADSRLDDDDYPDNPEGRRQRALDSADKSRRWRKALKLDPECSTAGNVARVAMEVDNGASDTPGIASPQETGSLGMEPTPDDPNS